MLYYIYIVVLVISFLCSLVSFRLHYTFHLKLFSILLGITVLTELCASYLPDLLTTKTNYPAYNIFILIQGIMYAFYFRLINTSSKIKMIINLFLLLFILSWFITTIFYLGLNVWNSYLVMTGDLFIVCLCGLNLYRLFTSEDVLNLWHYTEFWIAAGSVIYFSCELPITGMLNFMSKNYESQALVLREVLQLLNIIMYSIFIYAFLCPLIQTPITKSHSS